MATNANLRYRTKIASADLSAKQFFFVKLTAAGEQVAVCDTLGEVPFGILQNAPASGEEALVVALADGGKSKVSLAENVTDGAALTTDANGEAILADTTGHNIVGYAEKDGSNNEIGEINVGLNGTVA